MQNKKYAAIIISPHIDDAVFSCGGLMALYAAQNKSVLVINIFSDHTGDQNQNADSKFFTVASNRHKEDEKAQGVLAFDIHNLNLKDAIFRNADYLSARHLFSGRPDETMIATVREHLDRIFKYITGEELYFPLGVGGHVDHMTCYQACLGQWRDQFRVRAAYEDMPYSYLPGLVALRKGNLSFSGVSQLAEDFFASAMMSGFHDTALSSFYHLGVKSFFMYRWLHQKQDSASFLASLAGHELDISKVFDLKLKASWCYDSQTPQFLRSEQEQRAYSEKYAKAETATGARHVERYWHQT